MKNRNIFQIIKEYLIIIGRAIKNGFKRMFFGTHKELSLLEEEAVQSPLRTTIGKFFKKRLAIIGLIGFFTVFGASFIGSQFIPLDREAFVYQNPTQTDIRPGFNLMRVPRDLQNNGILDMAISSRYSMGIDKQNNVYIWGNNVENMVLGFPKHVIPDEIIPAADHVKEIKGTRVWSGRNHFLVEQMDGTLVMYAPATNNFTFGVGHVPDNVQQAIIDDGGILHVAAHSQISLVITNQNRMFQWGNDITRTYRFTAAILDRKPIAAAYTNSNLAILFQDGTIRVLGDLQGSIRVDDLVAETTNVIQMVTTSYSIILLKDDGTLEGWGANDSTILSFQYYQPFIDSYQGRIASLSKSAVGSDMFQHINAVLDDGSVYSWGSDKYGETNPPKKLMQPGANVAEVYGGFYQNYAVDADGNLMDTWGLRGHLFGTDGMGRDVFERVIHGGRISLTIGLLAVVISLAIGVIVGGISGFYSGRVDVFLMRVTEIVGSIPFFPLAMTFSKILNDRLPPMDPYVAWRPRMIMIMIILGVLSWPGLARLVRAQILAEREKEFVTAAKALGVKERNVIFKHIIPNVITVIIVSATLSYAGSLLTESGLSFLGFGVQGHPTWGNMLSGSQDMGVIVNYWWRWVFPSIFLCVATISINLVGDGLRDAIDPRSTER